MDGWIERRKEGKGEGGKRRKERRLVAIEQPKMLSKPKILQLNEKFPCRA